jgi:hypothetical protein
MKTKITYSHDTVTIAYTNIWGDRISRTFWVPATGGYVREGSQQVCRKLSTRGDTLMSTRATLLDDIRREYRAMRRSEQTQH